MSKALKYLAAARPEAMEAYFGFLRASGTRLDPKTRALISIITKVASQTEAGLKQYSKKALREGVSGDEILDALMMAFPALGLTKIVWAIDILLESDVLQDLTGAEDDDWSDLGPVHELGGVRVVETAKGPVFVAADGTTHRVFAARCPHHGTSLAFCQIRDNTVECPLHNWRFDVRTGTCTRFGTQDLTEFETRVLERRLQVRM